MKTRRARRRGVMGGLLVTSFFIVFPLWVCAAVPQRMSYQGYLTDSGGNPLHGTVTLTFSIYASATGGHCAMEGGAERPGEIEEA